MRPLFGSDELFSCSDEIFNCTKNAFPNTFTKIF